MRRHPFAQSWRAHQGIDYAAPVGTRVRAVGDGVVEFAGVRSGYGNVVVLRHRGQYATTYAHLSRFAAGVRRAQRWCRTHHRLRRPEPDGLPGRTCITSSVSAGVARNPFSIAMPAGLAFAGVGFSGVPVLRQPAHRALDLLANSNLAQLE